MRIMRVVVPTLAACSVMILLGQGQSVVDTSHNLSVSGPGVVRASGEDEVCIFCHTPHNASPIVPLWNRRMPVGAYSVYTSKALDARPGQPTGSSKLCLSCHDGTIALGGVLSRDQPIQMAGGITTIPPGASNLGTDLSDDHPISFAYDAALVVKDPKLLSPALLPAVLSLDHNQELQCMTCHDAHDNSFGDFLVMDNQNSNLCRTCHKISNTTIPSHRDCVSCHRTHSAPSGPDLLAQDRIRTTCVDCHDGSTPGAANILADLMKFSAHDTDSKVDPPDPIPGHSTCADCHDPHTMTRGHATAPDIHPNFGTVSGVTSGGVSTASAQNEYEVCYKCHADDNALTASYIPRVVTQVNTRLEFAPNAASFHPVEAPGRNPDVPSLKPPYTVASMIYCSDCHGSDSGGGSGMSRSRGVHGSNEEPLLVARYDTDDGTPESSQAYALCYSCHYRQGGNGILEDRSFSEHKKHIRDENTPCSVCHDAHGVSSLQGSTTNNSHLINFDASVVFPYNGKIEFIDEGRFRGSCTLVCHGEVHDREEYD